MSLDVLAEDDVAEILRCAVTTVQDRARAGDLPGLKFGEGGWVFPAGALAHRLDELALEQAQQRRTPRVPSGVLQSLPKAGKPKRVLPLLPVVPTT